MLTRHAMRANIKSRKAQCCKRKGENKMSKLYYVRTNGYDLVIYDDRNGKTEQGYVLTETSEFPKIYDEFGEMHKERATEFLNQIEDYSSWENDCDIDEILNSDDVEIIAEIETEL